MKNNRKTKEPFIENYKICECLKELFEAELRLGNKVRGYDPTASWPYPDDPSQIIRQRFPLNF